MKHFDFKAFIPAIEARIGCDGSIGVHNANRSNKAEEDEDDDEGSGSSEAESGSEDGASR